jgi:hypothetical protein
MVRVSHAVLSGTVCFIRLFFGQPSFGAGHRGWLGLATGTPIRDLWRRAAYWMERVFE